MKNMIIGLLVTCVGCITITSGTKVTIRVGAMDKPGCYVTEKVYDFKGDLVKEERYYSESWD